LGSAFCEIVVGIDFSPEKSFEGDEDEEERWEESGDEG